MTAQRGQEERFSWFEKEALEGGERSVERPTVTEQTRKGA
jgi:hypothetical protein